MVPPTSHGVPRAPWYLGVLQESLILFADGTVTLFGRPFQTFWLRTRFVTLRSVLIRSTQDPVTPMIQRIRAYRSLVWAVPLSLATTEGISVISFPPGTEMFHFPGFASRLYVFKTGSLDSIERGFPIRISPDQSLLAAPRGLTQLATSFIAT